MLTVNVAFRNLYYCLYCLGVCGHWGRITPESQERSVTRDMRRHAKTSESFLYLNVPSITCEVVIPTSDQRLLQSGRNP